MFWYHSFGVLARRWAAQRISLEAKLSRFTLSGGRAYGSAMSVNDAGWEESFRYDMSQREADWWKSRFTLSGAVTPR